ncbi:hypothetical protein B0A55_03263 [Friedmanniomyces simplex]|uniref:Uncharacterized protein n=1 Tax=Friedmanniomyces simplex TaxID=329884 RepID=A0A4U0XNX1_9PEZI|nr:hypothetical protein B0A55_03263 [Friedmanniomyces simplex]
MTGLLFTGHNADDRKINVLLLTVGETGSTASKSPGTTSTSSKAKSISTREMPYDAEYIVSPTSPSVPPMVYDGWAGGSIAEVETCVTDQALNHRIHEGNTTRYLLT